MRKQWMVMSICGVGLLLTGWLVGQAQIVPRRKIPTFSEALATKAEVNAEIGKKVLEAIGPCIQDQLAAGREVRIPGLGSFRVVRIPPHRDLQGGRPIIVKGRNYVEFTPDGALVAASNSPAAKPYKTVQPFKYDPLSGQTPSPKSPRTRVPGRRVR